MGQRSSTIETSLLAIRWSRALRHDMQMPAKQSGLESLRWSDNSLFGNILHVSHLDKIFYGHNPGFCTQQVSCFQYFDPNSENKICALFSKRLRTLTPYFVRFYLQVICLQYFAKAEMVKQQLTRLERRFCEISSEKMF
jgi:hypothetical protein